MGQRPSSIIVYGFELDEDNLGKCDDSEHEEAWESVVAEAAGCGAPDFYNRLAYADWSDEQRAEYREISARARVVVLKAAGPVRWGALFDEPDYAFGLVLAETDWDQAVEVGSLVPPPDAEEQIKKACDHFGVQMRPCKVLLLAGYG